MGEGEDMGIEQVLIASIIASTVSTVASGFAGQQAAESEASLQEAQASLSKQEADIEADRVDRANTLFRKKQKLAFIKSGLELEGTPLLFLEETRREGAKEVKAIRRRGEAIKGLGFAQASQTRSKGRAKLIGSITKGASDALGTFALGKSQGIFEKQKSGGTS